MSERPDVLVIGGGPAGANAAITAAERGADVVLVDENPRAGGQVYRSLPRPFRVSDSRRLGPDFAAGTRLRERLDRSTVTQVFDSVVWSVAPGFRVDAIGPDGPRVWHPRALVLAPGTTERVVPFPGWTQPGVVGLAASTILLKSQRVLPGRRTVVAGTGPLLAAVAHGVVKGGGEVPALVDLNSRRRWAMALRGMASRPTLLARGARWLSAVRRSGTGIYFQHTIRSVESRAGELRVEIGPVDAQGAPLGGPVRRLTADAVAVGHGLVPATEMTRLLGVEQRFDASAGGWYPARTDDLGTRVDGLFVVGDGAGISGAAAAEIEGVLAGLSAARWLGHLGDSAYNRGVAPLRRRRARAVRFGRAVADLMAVKPDTVDAIPDDTLVCRCEDVSRGDLESAIAAGARDMNQLKAWTRCGMGPCQGRMCGDTVGELLARHVGGREAAGQWTARVPMRPLPLAGIAGDFSYDDIPTPGAAPL